jgi:uncharacterized protein (TIGR02099 family)
MVTLSVAVITLALMVAVARALLPYANHASGWVESLVSRTIDRTVTSEHVDGHWRAFGPEFYIDGLSIQGPDGQSARFDRASVRIDLYGALLGRRSLVTVTVFGANMQVRRAVDGRLHVAGVELKQQVDLSWLIQRGRLELAGGQLAFNDEISGLAVALDRVDLAVADGAALRVQGVLRDTDDATVELIYRGNLLNALSSDGRLYVAMNGVNNAFLDALPLPVSLPTWRGQMNAQLWLETVDGQPADLAANVRLESALGAGRISATGNWRPTLQGWDGVVAITTRNATGQVSPTAQLQVRKTDEQLGLALDRIDLEPLLGFLPSLPGQGELPWRPNSSRLGGQLIDLQLLWQQAEDGGLDLLQGQGRLESFLLAGIAPSIPDIDGIEVDLIYGGNTLAASIRGDAPILHYPRVFPQSLLLGELELDARLTHGDGSPWRFQIDHASTLLANAEVSLHGQLRGTENGVFADLRYGLINGDASFMADVLPMGIMPEPLTRWLLGSVTSGLVSEASGILHGPLSAFPFRENQGLFEINAQLNDARLKFRPEWPAIDDLGARLRFRNSGMLITADRGVSAGMRLRQASADIADFRQPWLRVQADASGTDIAAQRYLRASPLLEQRGDVLQTMGLEAQTDLQLALEVPLRRDLGEIAVQGEVAIADGRLTLAAMPWPIEQINGQVVFDREGVALRKGTARLQERAFTAEFQARKQHFELQAQGSAEPARLLKDLLPDSDLLDSVSGETAVDVRVRRVSEDGLVLLVESPLEGVAVDLPAPMRKAAAQSEHLTLRWPLGDALEDITIAAGERLRLRSRQLQDGREWALRFGSEWPELGGKTGITVSGEIQLLDADGWLSRQTNDASRQTEAEFQSLALDVAELRLQQRRFNDLAVSVARDERYWQIGLDSEALAGRLRLPAAGSADVLVADLQRLHWPAKDESLPQREMPSPRGSRELPSLQVVADDLRFGPYTLGEFRLEAFPDINGYRIERLETRRKGTDIIASGHWYRGARARSVFEVRLTAGDLGQLLSDFGYANLVRGGQTRLAGVAEWPGAPWEVSLANLQGRLDVDVGQGQIVEVEPGAGRVLGLLSLQALPRRLALDFTDFFGEGFSFDAMAGRFEFSEGLAETDELAISALSADIFISGSTNLLNKTYDQTVVVVPRMSNALPVVGALAGGAAGAAALWVLQEAFQAPMGQLARARYSVTGPWQEPQVQLVERTVPSEAEPDNTN